MALLAAASTAFAGTAATVPGAPAAPVAPSAVAAPAAKGLHVTMRSDFAFDCARMAPVGEKTRLYFDADGQNYMDVASREVLSAEVIDLPTQAPTGDKLPRSAYENPAPRLQASGSADIPSLIATAGAHNNLDPDLIAAIVRQESNSNPHAVSRVGARGLMQLMPNTAARIGVQDSFDPSQNVEGGTAYFNSLLLRYHDDPYLALAAYNAGPGAVDKYHGIPPYRETRAYVARIIRDFNRRKALVVGRSQTLQTHAAASVAVLAAGIVR